MLMAVINHQSKSDEDQLRRLITEIQIDFLTVRDRKGLADIIVKKFFNLFDFDELVISIADHHNLTHKNFLHCTRPGLYKNDSFFRVSEPGYNFNDGFYDVTMARDYASVWNLDKILNWDAPPPYLVNLHRNQVKKILGVTLKSARSDFGCMFFLSGNKEAFSANEPDIAFEMANFLAAALNNILFAEATERRERDKQGLFELITLIASVKDRTDLERIAKGHLKDAFQFNDLIIPILNQDYLTHKVCLSYFDKEINLSEMHLEAIRKGACCSNDGIIDTILQSDYPVVWNITDVLKWQMVPLYIQIWAEHNIKRLTGIPIRSKGKVVGAILFASTFPQAFMDDDLSRLNVLKNQLSITVLNILANEEKINREYEKDILLSLSNDIAAIRNKEELELIVRQKIKPLLPFNDFIVMIPVPGQQSYGFFVYILEEKRRVHEEFKGLKNIACTADSEIIFSILTSEEPVIVSMEQLQVLDDITNHLNYLKKTGIKEIIGSALRNGKHSVGLMFLTSEQDNTFSTAQMGLIRSITGQLSIVISNILANDIIADREKDVSFLLTFINEISTARSRNKLRLILDQKIRRFISFTDIAIIFYDEENRNYQNLFPVIRKDQPDCLFGNKTIVNYRLADALLQIVKQTDGPVIISFSDLNQSKIIEAAPSNEPQQLIGVCIRNGKKILGGLFLQQSADFTLSKKDYNLLLGITDQLSFSVVNILTYERTAKIEKEQKLLLELSKGIAKVRNKTDLVRLISERLTEVLKFTHTLILKINEDDTSGHVFLNRFESYHNDNNFLSNHNEIIPLENSILQDVLSVETPVIFLTEEITDSSDMIYFRSLGIPTGIKKMIAISCCDNKRAIGILVFFSPESDPLSAGQLALLQGFSVQLSIAIANITANEKIEQQVLEIAGSKKQLEVENLYLQEEIQTTHNYSELVGMSAQMHDVFRLLTQVSESQSSVLLLGETGTGKELIARAIHNNSKRKGKVMVKVNCATLPANLIESELFGHERGSFTGATDKRIGKFELANNSTIFLDEIGEMPLDLQVKLLRALQEKEIERVGGRSVINVDVRVIAATNRDLMKEVQMGNFRSDLFFRLNVFPITIPPLRNRIDDIPLLAAHFLEKHNKKANKKVIGFSPVAIKEMMSYSWPGNVRELEHLIERTILMASQPTINHLDLPASKLDSKPGPFYPDTFKTIDEVERDHILAVLKSCRGKVGGAGGAAEILKLPATTVHSKMKKLGIGKKFSTGTD
jgi:formate hydrogenlyase transcriptional activator